MLNLTSAAARSIGLRIFTAIRRQITAGWLGWWLVAVLGASSGWAATPYPPAADSLRRLVGLAALDTHQVRLINDLTLLLVRAYHPDALRHGRDAIARAQGYGTVAQRATAYHNLAIWYQQQGQVDSARALFRRGLEQARRVQDTVLIVKVTDRLALLEIEAGRNQYGIDMYRQMLPMCRQIEDQVRESTAYNNMALAFFTLNTIDSAVHYYQQSVRVSEQAGDTIGVGYGYGGLGDVYYNAGRLADAKRFYRKSLELLRRTKARGGQQFGMVRLAEIYIEQDSLHQAAALFGALEADTIADRFVKYYTFMGLAEIADRRQTPDTALPYRQQALAAAHATADPYLVSPALTALAGTLVDLNRPDEALPLLMESEAQATALADSLALLTTYSALIRTYEATANLPEALAYVRRRFALQDSLHKRENTRTVAEMQERFNAEQQAQDLALLREQAALADAKITLRNVLLYGAVGLLCLFLAFVYQLTTSRNQHRMQNRTLTQQNDEIKRMNAALRVNKLEIEQQQQLLEQRFDKVRQLNEEKNQIIGVVAHDLKSPVNQVKGLVALMMSETMGPAAREFATLIGRAADNMHHLVVSLLDAERSETIDASACRVEVRIGPWLKELVEEFTILADQKSLKLRFEAADAGLCVLIDPQLGALVVRNFLSNAIKFSPARREISVAVVARQDTVYVRVRDQGPGIGESEKSQLFGKFKKLSNRPTGRESSTGLGLYIAQQYARANGGEVGHEDAPGGGSVFWVSFPRLAGALPAEDIPAASTQPDRRWQPTGASG